MTKEQFNKEVEKCNVRISRCKEQLKEKDIELEKLLREAIALSKQLSTKLTREIIPFHNSRKIKPVYHDKKWIHVFERFLSHTLYL